MKIAVTGGSGFLGSHLVDELIQRGHEVTVFDRIASRWLPSRATFVAGDLADREALQSLVTACDAVYHLAGFADLNAARLRPLDTAQVNIVGTINILEAMRAAGVSRFLFASTVYVYSRDGGFYRCSKQACESYVEEYGRAFGIQYTVLRYGSLYGPRSDYTNGVYRLLSAAMHDGRIRYVGNPDDIREYIHVEDAARLSADALDPSFNGQHILLTGPSPTRAADLFMMFQEILGRQIDVAYGGSLGLGNGHYSVTPYAYTPKPGRKLVSTHYVDMGQGLLRLIEDLQHERQRA
ncbi:MAG: NAD-dependent epimerase/dehydratase family protein [Kofleriaceae bacterium]